MRRAALLLLLAACQSRTELMLGVATDFAAPDIVDEVRLEVSRAGTGVPQQMQSWPIGRDAEFNLPGSFGIFSDEGALPIEIVLTGLKGNTPVVTRRARLSLVEGETLFYRMGLTAACRDMSGDCPAGTTCVEGRCEAEEIVARMLPTFTDAMVMQLTCQSGASYLDTADGMLMPLSADANACPSSLCAEGTCLVPPSGARMYRGACFAAPFDLLIDGNELTVTALGRTVTATGTVSGSAFQATVQLEEGVTANVEGTKTDAFASGVLTVVDGGSSIRLPFSAIGGSAVPYCGTFTRSDGFTAGTQWTLVAGGGRATGQYGGTSDAGTEVFGAINGSVNGDALSLQWENVLADGLGEGSVPESGMATGRLDAPGRMSGTWMGTSAGRAVSGTFTADSGACRSAPAGGCDCPAGTECVDGTCVGLGALRFTVQWDAATDVDLHVLTPNGNEISYTSRMADTGTLDIDDTGGGSLVENVFFTAPPTGRYEVWVRNFNGTLATNYTLVIATQTAVLAEFSGQLPAQVVDSQRYPIDFTTP